MSVNYDEFNFFSSHIAHEIKRLGNDEFVKKYNKLLKQNKINGKLEVAYVQAMIDYITNEDNGLKEKTDKFVLGFYAYFWIAENNDFEEANYDYENAIEAFKRHGFILSKVEEAV